MKRARENEYLDIVKESQTELRENIAEWNKYPRLKDYFDKNNYEMDEDGTEYVKVVSEAPYTETITVELDEGVIDVHISLVESGSSKSFGDEFTNEKEAVVYLGKVESGQITEAKLRKQDWGSEYDKLVKAKAKENKDLLMANSEDMVKALEGKKKKKKKKKKSSSTKSPYGSGYRGGWGMGLQDWGSSMNDGGDFGGDGGGDGGGGE